MSSFLGLKSKANALYSAQEYEQAILIYQSAMSSSSTTPTESTTTPSNTDKAVIYSNIAACYLKLQDDQSTIGACTQSLALDSENTKAYYRRATAYYHLHNKKAAMSDLTRLLSIDSKNKDALDLMKKLRFESQVEMKDQSHVGYLLELIDKRDKVSDCLQTLLSLSSDNDRLGFEFIRKGGLKVLGNFLESSTTEKHDELALLGLKLAYSLFNQQEIVVGAVDLDADSPGSTGMFLTAKAQWSWCRLCSLIDSTHAEVPLMALRLCIRVVSLLPLTTHVYTDDLLTGEQYSDNKLYNEALLQTFHSSKLVIQKPQIKVLLREIKTLLSKRHHESSQVAISSLLSLLATTNEGVEGKLPEYVDYRNESTKDRKRRNYDLKWLSLRANLTAAAFIDEGGIGCLLSCMNEPAHSDIRRASGKCLGALVSAYSDEAAVKSLLSIYLQESSAVDECLTRALLETVLCLSHPDLGLWAVEQHEGVRQLVLLVSTGDSFHQEVVSELVYLLASQDKGVGLLDPVARQGGVIQLLLQSSNPTTRSNAASAISKIAFKKKTLSETSNETTHLLNVSLDIIKSHVTKTPLRQLGGPQEEGDKPLVSFSSFDNVSLSKSSHDKAITSAVTADEATAVERAVEVVASLVGQTVVKEELTHGSHRVTPSLSYLLSLPMNELAFKSTLAYGIVHIISSITVTNNELHQAQLAEKGITLQQYYEMQELQRIKAEDAEGKKYEEQKTEVEDRDTDVVCASRIKKVVEAKAIQVLVQALDSELSTSKTKLSAATAFKQICVEASVRGKFIVEGGLKCCLSIATDTSADPQVRRLCTHAIAKALVTTNSTIVSSHQRLGAIKPLLAVCNEDGYSDLEHFESLMALTNLTSLGEAEQNAFAANKGPKIVYFLMLSENNMVQRAAAELMCNMSGHKVVCELFVKRENLRVLLGLCRDWAADAEEDQDVLSSPLPLALESYKTARAAAGALASLCNDADLCRAVVQEKGLVTLIALLGSVKYELLHRAIVVLQSISEHCAIQLKEANEEMLADLYAPDVAAARVIEIAVSASMSSLKNLSQNDPNMIKVLEKLVKQLLSALARIL